ncbi:hypothetical protein [Lysinibacillus fusiformis]|uniref:hypothetical protein n=1 Tax=Lysinibacillus fusiformis TaxID=28031 RepID=UPI0021C0769E|nr:hypothetical protein [Lysinibacillus fusiformis]UXJ69542.1 hypothetical protein N5069_03140 [Lysinibacillus fusiformis]
MNELVVETMDSYNQYIKNIVNGCELIYTNLRNNDEHVLKAILQFSEGVSWLIEVNQKLAGLGYPNEFSITTIETFFQEVNSGLEIQDYLLVADLFEYEIKPFFETVSLYDVTN